MPLKLKLPGALKTLLPGKKSGSKKRSAKHKGQDTDSGAASPPAVPEKTKDDTASGISATHPQDSNLHEDAGSDVAEMPSAHNVRGLKELPQPAVSMQLSCTSDYTSQTSMVSGLSFQRANSTERPPEGLPDLTRSLDPECTGQFCSTDSCASFDSGVENRYPTVIQRRKNPSTSVQEKAASCPSTRHTEAGNISSDQRSTTSPSQESGSPSSSSERHEASFQTENDAGPSSASPPQFAGYAPRGKNSPATVPVRSRKVDNDVIISSFTAPVTRREAGAAEARVMQQPTARLMPAEEAGLETETFPEIALETPIGALRKSRKRLCLMLNVEQPQIDTEWTPDYMGLADMLGFESLEIQNFWERNPADTLFMDWSRCHDGRLLRPVLATLLDCLDRLGRQDIVRDCRGLIDEDVSDYLAEQRLLESYTVGQLQKFDCYVNIAEQDLLGVGREILQNLEGVHGLRLCLTLRNVTLGAFEFEEMLEMLETRCDSKVIIVLTKSYEESDACQFLTQFAVTLDPGSRRSKLIPMLVDEDTHIPRVLRSLAMLNYHRDKRLGFLWPRLKQAIKA